MDSSFTNLKKIEQQQNKLTADFFSKVNLEEEQENILERTTVMKDDILNTLVNLKLKETEKKKFFKEKVKTKFKVKNLVLKNRHINRQLEKNKGLTSKDYIKYFLLSNSKIIDKNARKNQLIHKRFGDYSHNFLVSMILKHGAKKFNHIINNVVKMEVKEGKGKVPEYVFAKNEHQDPNSKYVIELENVNFDLINSISEFMKSEKLSVEKKSRRERTLNNRKNRIFRKYKVEDIVSKLKQNNFNGYNGLSATSLKRVEETNRDYGLDELSNINSNYKNTNESKDNEENIFSKRNSNSRYISNADINLTNSNLINIDTNTNTNTFTNKIVNDYDTILPETQVNKARTNLLINDYNKKNSKENNNNVLNENEKRESNRERKRIVFLNTPKHSTQTSSIANIHNSFNNFNNHGSQNINNVFRNNLNLQSTVKSSKYLIIKPTSATNDITPSNSKINSVSKSTKNLNLHFNNNSVYENQTLLNKKNFRKGIFCFDMTKNNDNVVIPSKKKSHNNNKLHSNISSNNYDYNSLVNSKRKGKSSMNLTITAFIPNSNRSKNSNKSVKKHIVSNNNVKNSKVVNVSFLSGKDITKINSSKDFNYDDNNLIKDHIRNTFSGNYNDSYANNNYNINNNTILSNRSKQSSNNNNKYRYHINNSELKEIKEINYEKDFNKTESQVFEVKLNKGLVLKNLDKNSINNSKTRLNTIVLNKENSNYKQKESSSISNDIKIANRTNNKSNTYQFNSLNFNSNNTLNPNINQTISFLKNNKEGNSSKNAHFINNQINKDINNASVINKNNNDNNDNTSDSNDNNTFKSSISYLNDKLKLSKLLYKSTPKKFNFGSIISNNRKNDMIANKNLSSNKGKKRKSSIETNTQSIHSVKFSLMSSHPYKENKEIALNSIDQNSSFNNNNNINKEKCIRKINKHMSSVNSNSMNKDFSRSNSKNNSTAKISHHIKNSKTGYSLSKISNMNKYFKVSAKEKNARKSNSVSKASKTSKASKVSKVSKTSKTSKCNINNGNKVIKINDISNLKNNNQNTNINLPLKTHNSNKTYSNIINNKNITHDTLTNKAFKANLKNHFNLLKNKEIPFSTIPTMNNTLTSLTTNSNNNVISIRSISNINNIKDMLSTNNQNTTESSFYKPSINPQKLKPIKNNNINENHDNPEIEKCIFSPISSKQSFYKHKQNNTISNFNPQEISLKKKLKTLEKNTKSIKRVLSMEKDFSEFKQSQRKKQIIRRADPFVNMIPIEKSAKYVIVGDPNKPKYEVTPKEKKPQKFVKALEVGKKINSISAKTALKFREIINNKIDILNMDVKKAKYNIKESLFRQGKTEEGNDKLNELMKWHLQKKFKLKKRFGTEL